MTQKLILVREDVYLKTDLADLIPQLQELLEKHGETASLSVDIEYDCTTTKIEYQRPETPKEAKQREANEESSRAARKRHYENLKKEFEK